MDSEIPEVTIRTDVTATASFEEAKAMCEAAGMVVVRADSGEAIRAAAMRQLAGVGLWGGVATGGGIGIGTYGLFSHAIGRWALVPGIASGALLCALTWGISWAIRSVTRPPTLRELEWARRQAKRAEAAAAATLRAEMERAAYEQAKVEARALALERGLRSGDGD